MDKILIGFNTFQVRANQLSLVEVQWIDSDDSSENSEAISPDVIDYVDPNKVHSRVLQDAFHLMDRLKLDAQHGSFGSFMRDFSEALFIEDQEDLEKVIHVLERKDLEISTMPSKYIRERVKRIIPAPVILRKRIDDLFCLYKDQIDFKTISLGLVSDPPGISMYFEEGEDSDG